MKFIYLYILALLIFGCDGSKIEKGQAIKEREQLLRTEDDTATIEEVIKPLRILKTYEVKVTFFGITVELIDDQVKEKYGLLQNRGCYISDPGKNWKELGFSNLEPGSEILHISDIKNVKWESATYPISLAAATLEFRTKTIVVDGKQEHFLVRWHFRHPKTMNKEAYYYTELVRVTPAGLKELEALFRPITIAGVTFTYTNQDLRNKYNLIINDNCAIVTSLKKDVVYGGMAKLREGQKVYYVTGNGKAGRVFCPVNLGLNIINCIKPSQEDPSYYTCDLNILTYKKGVLIPDSNTILLNLKEKDIRALATTLKQVK